MYYKRPRLRLNTTRTRCLPENILNPGLHEFLQFAYVEDAPPPALREDYWKTTERLLEDLVLLRTIIHVQKL